MSKKELNNTTDILMNKEGENTMKNIKNNPFAQTLAREEAAREAAEAAKTAKEQAEQAKNDAIEAEKKYDDVKDYNLVDATQALAKNEGRIPVELAGVIIDYAASPEEAERLIEDLHHYGKNLLTEADVRKAMAKREAIQTKARELIGADFVPDTSYEIDGVIYLIKGKKAYTLQGNLYAELDEYSDEDLTNAKIREELFTKRIREKVKTVQPKVARVPATEIKLEGTKIRITEDADIAILELPCSVLIGADLVGYNCIYDVLSCYIDRQDYVYVPPMHKAQFINDILEKLDKDSPIKAKTYKMLGRKVAESIYSALGSTDTVGMMPSVGAKLADYLAKAILDNSLIAVVR